MNKSCLISAMLSALCLGCGPVKHPDINSGHPGAATKYDPEKEPKSVEYGHDRVHAPDINSDRPGGADTKKDSIDGGSDINSDRPGGAPE